MYDIVCFPPWRFLSFFAPFHFILAFLFLLWLYDSFSFALCVMVMNVRDSSDINSDIARVDVSKFNMGFPGFPSLL